MNNQQPLNELTSDQWQSLLAGAIYLLINSTDPPSDLQYAQWLVDQWNKARSK